MVASQDGQSVLEADLERDQQGYSFHRIVAPVHIVTHKQVVCVRRRAACQIKRCTHTYSEEFFQVVELSVDVAADSDRSAHLLHVGFLYDSLFCLNC